MENDTLLNTLKKDADKVINVTYMLSGVLEQSFQEMDEILDRLYKRLHHEDRRLINSIRKNIKFLNSNIESLRTHSLSKMDEETVECFDDTTLRFYVIFMKLLEIAGMDYLCDLRLYSLYNLLDKYQSLTITSYPKLDSRAKIAFLQVKRDIENGQYSAEDMKNVFKLKDENRDK
jgi:hypothetical protein